MERHGEVLHAVNRAVGRHYLTGWFADPATASTTRAALDCSRLYTHEANYHPDGGQIFAPQNHAPFVELLAPPGDDVKPEDFVAFYCNGSFGIHIDPSVWHQPVFPLQERACFDNKQGRVHACSGAVTSATSFGTSSARSISARSANICRATPISVGVSCAETGMPREK